MKDVEKALGLGSDVVILDLEDAVAVSEKENCAFDNSSDFNKPGIVLLL